MVVAATRAMIMVMTDDHQLLQHIRCYKHALMLISMNPLMAKTLNG